MLRSEWTSEGDFILRFDSETTANDALDRLATLTDCTGRFPRHLTPSWATNTDLYRTMSNPLPDGIQQMNERL